LLTPGAVERVAMQNRIQALPDGCVFGTHQFAIANLLLAGTHVPTHLLPVKRVYQPNAGKSITPIGYPIRVTVTGRQRQIFLLTLALI
jgi:hypothetical protein